MKETQLWDPLSLPNGGRAVEKNLIWWGSGRQKEDLFALLQWGTAASKTGVKHSLYLFIIFFPAFPKGLTSTIKAIT